MFISFISNVPVDGGTNFICILWQDIVEDGVNVTTSHLPLVSAKFPVKVPPPSPPKFCFPSTAYLKGVVSAEFAL